MEQCIIPCNINLYDIISAFKKLRCLEWKQSNSSILEGDEVFIYVGKPISSILYKCRVNRANFSETKIDDSAFIINGETYENYKNHMELELLEEYDKSQFSIEVLRANGLKGTIQGPRRVKELEKLLNQDKYKWVNEIEDFISKNSLTGKEKEIVTKARVNQSIYRELLLKKYKTCSLCGIQNNRVLIASHIKPWSKCNPKEKIDVYNGLLLCPNHDKVFDSGLITFDNNGHIIISDELSYHDRLFLNLRDDMSITISEKSIKYMEFHRQHIFLS